ncbi:MarR family winged helix-turn-helix transcriptional regulator [Salsuginibacillus kocurii]|uniref:MarR family winged helix-turn-helix transcriptional regulator n=1 Tax=Salsuginibacillus kocurii TaxID=427078 RepID=UPI00035D2ABD|nr:MarR family transcriptional regulator [Salsuginibacillus kocurii]
MHEHQQAFNEITESLTRINRRLLKKMPISEISLTKRQEAILMFIFYSENVTMSGIAEYFDISKSAVSQALNKLEEQDIIVRTINKDNRREMDLSVGKKGEKIKEEFKQAEDMIVEKYLTKLNIEDLHQIRDLFDSFENIIIEEEKKEDE